MAEMEPRSISLKAARVNKGLTQTEACKRLHITSYLLSRYECGKQDVPLGVAWNMSALYGVPLVCLAPADRYLIG